MSSESRLNSKLACTLKIRGGATAIATARKQGKAR